MSKKQDNLTFYENDMKSFNQLDSEFDQHLACMKKHILLLFDKKSKQMSALWIKKLCEISDTTNGYIKQIRNTYSYHLLKNLENNEQLFYPFNQKPPIGPLKDLKSMIEKKSYESDNQDNYTKEIDSNLSFDMGPETIDNQFSEKDLDYIESNGNKNNNMNINKFLKYESSSSKCVMNRNGQKLHNDFNPFAISINQHNDALKNNEEKQKYSQTYILELQLKKMENKLQEEKINMQHQHNSEIQNILERKNNEIEKIKKNYKLKIKEDEEIINSLEKKLNITEKKLSNLQIESEEKIQNIKNEVTLMLDANKKENEKKINDLVNNYEKDKFELQKQHTCAFQELVDETNLRLKKVECEYNSQQSITDQVIHELENRTVLLKKEMENNIKIICKLENENEALRNTWDHLKRELDITKENNKVNETKLKESQNKQIEELKFKMKSEYSLIKEENDKNIEKLKKMDNELEQTKSSNEKKIEKYKNILSEKDMQIQNLNSINKKQEIQAENALNNLKTQIELDYKKLYDEMKDQINKAENDLSKSKLLREKQAKESQKQLEKLKIANEKQIEKLNHGFVEKETLLKAEFEEQKKLLTKQRIESFDTIQSKFQKQILENNQMFQTKIESLTATIAQLDTKSIELQRELIEANSLRKNQIIELAMLREDEKIRLFRDKEIELETLKFDFELKEKNVNEKINSLKEAHLNEIKNLTLKSNKECQKQNEIISSLEERIKTLKDENKKVYQDGEHNFNELAEKLEEEKNNIKKHYQMHIMKIEQEKDIIENKLIKTSSEYEHSLTKLKMQYEEKQRGLMPIDLKKEYEETIVSLKSQIQILQQRITLLQNEIDDRNHLINSSSCTASI